MRLTDERIRALWRDGNNTWVISQKIGVDEGRVIDIVSQKQREAEATKPKSAASSAIGPCNCDPHIETCDQCAPYLAGKGEPIGKVTRLANNHLSVDWFGKFDALKCGQELFTAPHPCPKCAEYEAELPAVRYTVEAIRNMEAKCAELELRIRLAEGNVARHRETHSLITAKCAELERDLAQWKNNHATVVAQARILKERDDMPIERVKAYEKWQETEAKLARAKEVIAEAEKNLINQGGTLGPFGGSDVLGAIRQWKESK